MTAEILSRDDLSFLLHDWLRVEELTDHAPFAEHSRDTFDAMLDASRELAVTSFRPHMRASDLDEPTFTSRDGSVHTHEAIAPALRAFADSGLA
ncbi:MAG: acyl-CoA dehydrogenase N-terminal domain-containing protein, partial [Corynebacterium sp.]|nr:acyl-CoA dehydrogenase N-terminal domain-containing protein [Corynebacterium sp.]